MTKTLRDTMLDAKMCQNCGLVDETGGVDFAGSGLYWYCERHLEERDEAAPQGAGTMNAATTQPKCLGGLCKNQPAFMVYAQVGGRAKETPVCDEHIQTIRNTVYVRPVDETNE